MIVENLISDISIKLLINIKRANHASKKKRTLRAKKETRKTAALSLSGRKSTFDDISVPEQSHNTAVCTGM